MTLQKPSKTFIYLFLIAISASLTLGCADRKAVRTENAVALSRAEDALTTLKQPVAAPSSLEVEEKPYFGNNAVAFDNGEPLPSRLEGHDSLVITFDRALTLPEIAARIQNAANVRVMVQAAQSTSKEGANKDGNNSALETFLPADGVEVAGGRVLWQGQLSNLLNQVADRFDAEWQYRSNAVVISQHIVRTFMLNALAGTVDVLGSVKSSTSDSSGGNLPSQTVDTTAKLSIWEEIQKTVENIAGTNARTSFSPATGTITVAGAPSAVHDIEKYLTMQNRLRLRRVSVETQILTVKLNKEHSNIVDLDIVIKNALRNQPFGIRNLGSAAENATMIGAVPKVVGTGAVITPTKSIASILIKDLSAISENVSVDYTGTLVTLSDQPAPLQVSTKTTYVARSTTSSTSDTNSSTSLEPGTIDAGLNMNVLPRVIGQDKVMLRVAIGLTDLVSNDDFTSGDGKSRIQLPVVDATGFLQNTVLQSGETLVLAGFEKKNTTDNESGLGASWNIFGGGSQNYGKGREIRVLLIKATILPEDPITVLADDI